MKSNLSPLSTRLRLLALIHVALLFVLSGIADAQVSYDELLQGDLGQPSAPTDIGALLLGTNTVSGRLENQSGFDADAFSFQIPVGLAVTDFSFTALTGDGHFLAVSQGAINEFSASENLIATLISDTDVGTNLLDGSLNSFGGSGVAGSLEAGSYSVWFQETDGSDVDYSLAITTVSTASIPEPSSSIFLFGALVMAGARRTRARFMSA